MVALLVLLGAAVIGGVVQGWWPALAIALALVVVVRPLCARLSLVGSRMERQQRWAVAVFGIRGVGSLYYLSYALGGAEFDDARALWSIVVVCLLVSITLHGVAATPVMAHVDRVSERRAHRRKHRCRSAGCADL